MLLPIAVGEELAEIVHEGAEALLLKIAFCDFLPGDGEGAAQRTLQRKVVLDALRDAHVREVRHHQALLGEEVLLADCGAHPEVVAVVRLAVFSLARRDDDVEQVDVPALRAGEIGDALHGWRGKAIVVETRAGRIVQREVRLFRAQGEVQHVGTEPAELLRVLACHDRGERGMPFKPCRAPQNWPQWDTLSVSRETFLWRASLPGSMTLDAAIAYVAEVTGDASLSWLEEAQQSSNDMETRVSGYHLQERDWLNALTDGNATKGDQQYRSLSSGLLHACEPAATMLDNLASRRNSTTTHLHLLDR